jgi:hypothetical protein
LYRFLDRVAAEEIIMAEKTYIADVAFESVKLGQVIVSEETERLTALLGAGYIHEMSGPVYAISDWVDDVDDKELLERFEDLDIVEVSTEPVKRGQRPKAAE